jgi:hypothetical protein
MVNVTGLLVKVAVIVLLPVIVTVVGLVLPVRSPLQWSKLQPGSGIAVSVTTVPSA